MRTLMVYGAMFIAAFCAGAIHPSTGMARPDATLETLQRLQQELAVLKRKLAIEKVRREIRTLRESPATAEETVHVEEPPKEPIEEKGIEEVPVVALIAVYGVGDTLQAEVWEEGDRRGVQTGSVLRNGWVVRTIQPESLHAIDGKGRIHVLPLQGPPSKPGPGSNQHASEQPEAPQPPSEKFENRADEMSDDVHEEH